MSEKFEVIVCWINKSSPYNGNGSGFEWLEIRNSTFGLSPVDQEKKFKASKIGMNFELLMNMTKTKWKNVIFFEGTIIS